MSQNPDVARYRFDSLSAALLVWLFVATGALTLCPIRVAASEAKATTSANTSGSASEVRYSKVDMLYALAPIAISSREGALGKATANAFFDMSSSKPVLHVSAAARAGGDDHEIVASASGSASWTDFLALTNSFIEPPASFLDINAVFRCQLRGELVGAEGLASCSYVVMIDRTNVYGEHLQYRKGGTLAKPGTIDERIVLPVPIDLFFLGFADGKTNRAVKPTFTLGIIAQAHSGEDPSEGYKWVGDGGADFSHTYELETIYLADKHGNPVSGFEDVKIVGDNGPYRMGPPPGGFLEEMLVLDRFGRRLNERGVTLVDWEGEIANPAVRLQIVPPKDATFPAAAVISCPEARVYFDEPSVAGYSGPTKTLTFTNSNPQPVAVSIFPDRDGMDEDWPITVEFTSASGATRTLYLNAHVIDQDQPARPVDFPVTLDFSQDRTGFFDDESARDWSAQMANDWAYFFADPGLDVVPAGAEQTFIWSSAGFIDGSYATNASSYRGYLLYAYGIDQADPPYRSGGEPSSGGGFLSAGGTNLPLRRSGGLEVEIKGNYNLLSWDYIPFGTDDSEDWYLKTNLSDRPNDFLSIPHHEMGHAFIFNPAQPGFANFKSFGSVKDARVLAYQGDYPTIDGTDHLAGAVDRLSGRGAFGNEYYGTMPARRWLITKLDLLVAQAIGYSLRDTSPFEPATIVTQALPRAGVGSSYAQTLQAHGGIPIYRWSVAGGSLPPGLALDSFTGSIAGTPTQTGKYEFVIRLEEYDDAAAPVEAPFSLRVEASILEITRVGRTPDAIEVSYRSILNHTYRLEASSDLKVWNAVAEGVPGTGEVVTTKDSSGNLSAKRFYRVVEL